MIKLFEMLGMTDLSRVKIRFNKRMGLANPIELFRNNNIGSLMEGQYWNNDTRRFNDTDYTVGLISVRDDLWLLFHVGKVIKDRQILNGIGYDYEEVEEFRKYTGRTIVRYKKSDQAMVRWASTISEECEVYEVLADQFDNDIFPGYENIDLSWSDLAIIAKKEGWRAALQNQKGVYLITDSLTGKMYVGSATGQEMLLGRWEAYIKTGHGGNKGLKTLNMEYIKYNFRYSVLEIFKSTAADDVVLDRESWWKKVLLTRAFGYNKN